MTVEVDSSIDSLIQELIISDCSLNKCLSVYRFLRMWTSTPRIFSFRAVGTVLCSGYNWSLAYIRHLTNESTTKVNSRHCFTITKVSLTDLVWALPSYLLVIWYECQRTDFFLSDYFYSKLGAVAPPKVTLLLIRRRHFWGESSVFII